jgi:hypothetical protein
LGLLGRWGSETGDFAPTIPCAVCCVLCLRTRPPSTFMLPSRYPRYAIEQPNPLSDIRADLRFHDMRDYKFSGIAKCRTIRLSFPAKRHLLPLLCWG